MNINDLRIQIYADGSKLADIIEWNRFAWIAGFTTNPTLMRKAGVENYESFAREVLQVVLEKPISFEVFADEDDEMIRQAELIASWGKNVFVKIPVTNCKGVSTAPVIKHLTQHNVPLNVTAVFTPDQVREVTRAMAAPTPGIVSVLAGRIADTGRDPVPLMQECLEILRPYPHLSLLWASPREPWNIVQANDIGCQIITVPTDQLKKLHFLGKDLEQFSLETVQMFYEDARQAGYTLSTQPATIC